MKDEGDAPGVFSLDAQRQFTLLVQGVIDHAIFMLDPDGRVASWNPGAERIKGYRPHEIIGRHFSRFYTEEDRQAGIPAQALRVAAREGRFEKQGWRVRKDGTRFWANVTIDAIRADSGRLVGYAKITRDITEQRDAALALEQAKEALYQSRKLDAIGQLTGGIAHDFNNLLMAVLGSLELLNKRLPDDPRTALLLNNATQAARRGVSLTQRLLAFARRQELIPQSVDLACLVQGMTDLLRRSIGPGVVIRTRFPAELSCVRADANQLEMALLNLAVNARDAMPDGGTVDIEADVVESSDDLPPGLPSGRYVRLSVTDTGTGMDEETRSRAMEPFFTTKGVGKGTGLGLSMVHGVAEQSGGKLRMISEPGRGTTAELWLPWAARDDQPAPAARRMDVAAVPILERSLSVLAVDDDNLVLTNMTAMMVDMNHTVLAANSGERALALLDGGAQVDLVLTDQAMPGMTGVDLARRIHARDADLPIILATGYLETPAGGHECLAILRKPFQQADLALAMANAMDRNARRDTRDASAARGREAG